MTPHFAQMQNKPIFLNPQNSKWFEACMSALDARLAHMPTIAASGDFWTELEGSEYEWLRPYKVVDGVLQVPVKGVLLHGFPYAFSSLATGYEFVQESLKRGMDDENVNSIALMIDSPGGMVAGCFDLADRIYGMRDQKPIKAFVESCYSAAYALGSSASSIHVTRSGGVGSIGVVTMHVDMSAAVEQAGYKITYIHAGKHKVDGNPYEPLPDDVKDRIQAEIDAAYSEFVALVARNRAMDEQAVRDTEAQCYMPAEAVSLGLADTVGPLDDAIAAFTAIVNPEKGVKAMAETQASTEDLEAARRDGAAAAQKRIATILGSDAAKTHPTAAMEFAMNSDMPADGAIAFMGKLPAEAKATEPEQTPAAPKGMFSNAMDKSMNPDLAAGGDDESATDPALALSQLIKQSGIPGFKTN